ncbi:MAG: nucleotidyltransferase domain-containing protein [Lachnospiraceae bacterium]|nr:nucleotidyltransferase domain-containing protein [Lachnospiraceae bacterium]
MNGYLQTIFQDFVDIMKTKNGVLGAWNFGSSLHGMSDAYSDVDVVFLVEGNAFQKIERELSEILSGVCEEVILCWEEDFNSHAIINNGYLLKKDHGIFQFDVFLLNQDDIGDFMCKVHYTDLTEKDIIFDTGHYVQNLCENCPHGSVWDADIEHLISTYLYHFYMTAKYLIRQDYFKLNHVMRTLYDTHVSLLLTAYDVINWGGAENKLHFLSAGQQEHLKQYFCTEDFSWNRKRLLQSMEWFQEDLCDVLDRKEQDYNMEHVTAVKEYWCACTVDIVYGED